MPQFVGGRYQLIAQLGGGGMADVYLAKLTGKADFAKLAVVKRLKALEDEEPEILKMFADEARLCARLNHGSIVQTFEVGEDTAGPFLVMEYVEGQPLGRIRSRATRRELTIPRAMGLQVLCETLSALAYAHTLADHDGTLLKVVHRDVSPENIMVTYSGTTKLVDFGVAKTAASLSHTRAGVLKGKVAYMAPEQARSDTTIDGRADVFAAGLILWELLTGRRHWEGLTERAVFERLLDKDPLPRTRSVDAEIEVDLDEICAKAMEKDKEARFATASEFLEALEGACAKLGLRASSREIGAFVAGLFEAERAKVKALVTEAMAKVRDDSTGESLPEHVTRASLDPAAPRIEQSDPLLWRGLGFEAPSDPSLMSSRSDGSSMPIETPSGVSDKTRELHPPQSSTQPKRLALISVGIVALLGAAVLVGTKLGAPPPAAPIVITPAVTPLPAPPPPLPVEIAVDIVVKPLSAKISIDGKSVAGNPHHLSAPRSEGSHEIRAEAEGYETRSMVVAFDRDRALDMNLVKSAPPATVVVAPPPVPVPPPTTPPRVTSSSVASHPTAPHPSAPASTGRGISEIDPTKPKGTKHDKIDTDVFKR